MIMLNLKKKILSAVVAFGMLTTFGNFSEVSAANVNDIRSISIRSDGSNFQYWNQNSKAFRALKNYVEDVTNPNSSNYIPIRDRIVVTDMDGTFYSELAPTYGEWMLYFHRLFEDPTYTPTETEKTFAEECLAAAKAGSISNTMDAGEDSAQSYAFEGMTLDEFDQYAENFLKTPLDGLSNATFGDAFYLPMLEMYSYLESNGFTIYVVTGADRQLSRNIVKNISAIDPAHVIGSDSMNVARRQGFMDDYSFEPGDVIVRGKYMSTNGKMMKVSNISREIGKIPVLAFGNSGSDAAMLNYTLSNKKYKTLAFGVLCDDNSRDWGNVDKAAKFKTSCEKYNWISISMRDDFKTIYGDDVRKTDQQFRK